MQQHRKNVDPKLKHTHETCLHSKYVISRAQQMNIEPDQESSLIHNIANSAVMVSSVLHFVK